MADYNDARWYVIHTYSGYENKVAKDLETIVENRKLQDYIMDIKIPTETVLRLRMMEPLRNTSARFSPDMCLLK